jgi:transposase
VEKQYVGIDLHRRRSLIVRRDDTGTTHSMVRLDNSDLAGIVAEVRAAGPEPEVIVEATNGWYWLVDLLRAEGAHVHLAHPLGNNWGTRRVKNDERDATDLVDLYRLGRLVESYVAPPELREQRELVRYRHKLVGFRTSCREQVHAVLAKKGVAVPMTDLFGVAGLELLEHVALGGGFAIRVESLRDLIELLDREVAMLDREIHRRLHNDPRFAVLQLLPGIGPVLAAILVTEIGDISRFSSPERLCSWAGLTPRHHESDTAVHRGSITRMGSRLVRWAIVEAVRRQGHSALLGEAMARVAERRGRRIAKVAAARRLLSLVFYALRDGELRCLASAG